MAHSPNQSAADRRTMQRELFPDVQQQRHLSPVQRRPLVSDLAAIANHVQAAGFNGRFRFYAAGSMLDGKQDARDIDIILCPRPGMPVSIADVETVLLSLRRFGIAELGIKIDACFRRIDEAEIQRRARAGLTINSWKLESPQLRWELEKGDSPGEMRRAGRFLVVVRRPLERTTYYGKLPLVRENGRFARVLRPAVPLHTFLNPPRL